MCRKLYDKHIGCDWIQNRSAFKSFSTENTKFFFFSQIITDSTFPTLYPKTFINFKKSYSEITFPKALKYVDLWK